MTVVWCSISAHGFGHAAQLTPLLNDLGDTIDDLHVILRTQVPADFFHRHLKVKWERQAAPQDIGCIQQGPLDVDVSATWKAYGDFHDNWKSKVIKEANAIRAAGAKLVIANISHLAIAGAAESRCPVVGIASLSWDRVLEPYQQEKSPDQCEILETIRHSYALADQFIRIHPAIDMPAFPHVADVGPSVPPPQPRGHSLRALLQAPEEDRLVLVAFGGIPLRRLPLQHMETMEGFQFLVSDLPSSSHYKRIHRLEDLALPFAEVSRQADILMTKPGYGTVINAIQDEKALVYVRRGNFVDEQSLVDYIHRHGRGMELSRKDFESGDWEATLRGVLSVPEPPEPPPLPGNQAVVRILKSYLQT